MNMKFYYANVKEKDCIRDLGVESEIKYMFKKQDEKVSTPVTGCCEYSNESSGSVKGKFIVQPYVYQHLWKNSLPWTQG